MSDAATRARCLQLIERLHGPGSVQAFLNCRQAELDDELGADMLEFWPTRLLAHLEARIALLENPARLAASRRSGEVQRVLGLLDEIEREGGRP